MDRKSGQGIWKRMNQEDRNRRPAHRGSASVRKSGTYARRPYSGETAQDGQDKDSYRKQNSARPARPVGEGRESSTYRNSQTGTNRSGNGSRSAGKHLSSTDKTYRTGAYGGNGSGSGKEPGKKKTAGLIIGICVIAIAAVLCVVFLLKSPKTEAEASSEVQSSETEESFAAEAIKANAAIVLSGVPGLSGTETSKTDESQTDESKTGEESSGSDTSAEEQSSDASVSPAQDSLLMIQGMTPDEIRKEIKSRYTWSMAIVNEKADVGATVKPTVDATETTEAATMGDAENPDAGGTEAADETAAAVTSITVENQIAVPDLIAARLDTLLEEIVAADEENSTSESSTQTVVYQLELGDTSAEAEKAAQDADSMWHKTPKGGSIGSYDKASDSFKMEGAQNGYTVDRDAVAEKIQAAIASGDYTAQIPVVGEVVKADAQANLAAYKIIGTFTTKTTSNKVRNKNIELACEKLNGTILAPGQEFSFNNVVGERTAAKGYGAAAAYNDGEVVQEIGGGICQVSSTLYNAVLRAGLKTTKRQSHTFSPNYVTPGMDATVSWGGPDYRFANVAAIAAYSNSQTYSIGIKAHYADRTVTVSIYGRPVLKDGYTYELSSKKTKEIPVVRKKIEPGSGKTPTKGSTGSQWVTNLVVKENGKVVSDKLDHNTFYTGHIAYYNEETTAAPTETSAPTESPSETPAQTPEETTQPTTAAPQTGAQGGPGVTAPQQTSTQPGPGASGQETQSPAPGNDAGGSAPGAGSTPGAGPGEANTPGSAGSVISDGPGAL